MIIYPTVLYIKQHSITGLKYFGKTTQDPYKYNGSGKHWIRHIKKHGKEHIITLWVSESFTESDLISEFALKFSRDNNIVESNEWANLIDENGLDGSIKGKSKGPRGPHSEETKAKISIANSGKVTSEETKAKLSAARLGKTIGPRGPHSEETKAKISIANSGKIFSEETKAKLSAAAKGRTGRTGRTHSEETKAKMSASRLARLAKLKTDALIHVPTLTSPP